MVNLETIISKTKSKIENFKTHSFNQLHKYFLITAATATILAASCCKPEPILPDDDNKIMITGQITNKPHNAHPLTNIVAKSSVNNKFLGDTRTNPNGSYSLLLDDEQKNFKLFYESEGHETFDTTLTAWSNHIINKDLNVIPENIQANYEIIVTNNSGTIENAVIDIYSNKNDDLLVSGKTNNNGSFKTVIKQKEWVFNNDTIRTINDIKTSVSALNHNAHSFTSKYSKNMLFNIALDELINAYNVSFNIQSTINDKTPKSFKGYALFEGDTIASQVFQGAEGVLSFEHNRGDLSVVVGANNIPHFKKSNEKILVLSNNNASVQLSTVPDSYTYKISGEVKKKNGDAVQALVIAEKKQTNTNSQGAYELSNMILLTDAHNYPTIYDVNVIASGDDFDKMINSVSVNGDDKVVNFEVANTIYAYTINANLVNQINNKKPKSARVYALLGADTVAVKNVNSTNCSLSFESLNPELELVVGVRNLPYFTGSKKNVSVQQGSSNHALNIEPLLFEYLIQGRVADTNQEPVIASITFENKTVNNDSQGNYLLNKLNRLSDDNNFPLTYESNIIAKGNFDDITKTLTINGENKTLNFDVPITTREANFTFKPITVDGDQQSPNNIIFVQLGDVIQTYTIGTNSEINVNITANTKNEYLKIWDEPPVNANNEPLYNEVTIIHKQNREWYEEPIKNNNQTVFRTKADQPFDTLKINIEDINNKHNLELIKMYNHFDHPKKGRLYTNNKEFTSFIGFRSTYTKMSHDPTPEGKGWKVLFLTHDVATGNPVSQKFMDYWGNALNQVLNASTRNDGQKTFDWEIIYIDSPAHPEYVTAKNNNWKNTLTIEPNNNYSMWTNGTGVHEANGSFYHSYGHARGPPGIPNIAVALEELIEPTYIFTDPVGSSVDFILKGPYENPELNNFAIRAVRFRQQLSHHTKLNYIVK